MCHKGVCQRERLCSPGESCLGSVGFGLEVLPAEIERFLGRAGLAQGHRRGEYSSTVNGVASLVTSGICSASGKRPG